MKKMKKKFLAIMMLSILSLSTVLSGCSSEDNSKDNDKKQESNDKKDKVEKGYLFSNKGIKISVDSDLKPVLEVLGEPQSYFEAPSCATEGIGKVYTYSDFQIDTYPDGEKDLILCITLKTDNVSTAEGIDLSMDKDKIIEVYGSDYEETDISMSYKKDGMKLSFIFEGDSLVSIQYDSSLNN